MTSPPDPRRRRVSKPNPMEEENFPTRSPTRDAVEREMREPSNVRGPTSPAPRREPPLKEATDGEEESARGRDA